MKQIFLAFLAILPGILISAYIYWRDRKEAEPLRLLFICFLFGILSVTPAKKLEEFGIYDLFITESKDPLMTFTFAFLIVAFSEELMKYIFLRYYIFPQKAFSEPLDGIVYSVAISMGFATIENFSYVMFSNNAFESALEIAYSRMFTAVPAHAVFAVVMGYYIGLARFNPSKESLYSFVGFLGAVLLHGTYDFFIFQELSEYLNIFTLFTLVIGLIISKKMINAHKKLSGSAAKSGTV
jgi:RsiW-degrading membrane proteinase PrsW (M82 family)